MMGHLSCCENRKKQEGFDHTNTKLNFFFFFCTFGAFRIGEDVAAKDLHILLTPSGCSPCSSVLTRAAFLSPDLLPGQAGKGSTNTKPPYAAPDDGERWVCSVLSQHIPWARGLWHYSCCAFISSPLHRCEVEDAVAVRRLWKAPPL